MSYIDIAIIAIIALMALVGLWKGAGKEIISLVCFALSVIACYFVADYCLKFVMEVEVIRDLALGDTFSIRALIGTEFTAGESAVVQMLCEPLLARYSEFALVWNITEAEFMSVAISLHLFTIVLSLLLYVAARIVASIIGYILKLIFVHGEPNIVSRIFGLVAGAVKGAATVCVLLVVVSAVFPFGFASVVTDAMDQSKIAPPVCEVVYEIAGSNLYSDETLELMLESAGFTKINEPSAPGEE